MRHDHLARLLEDGALVERPGPEIEAAAHCLESLGLIGVERAEFVRCADSADGDFAWARAMGGMGGKQSDGVAVDWDGPPPKPAWTWWQPAPDELATQWRTTPFAIDWTGDGLIDLVMLDPQGFLALYPRARRDDGSFIGAPQPSAAATPR